MADEYGYCVNDDYGNMACITSNRPLTPAEVDQYISIDTSVPPGNPPLAPTVPEDKPWYQDALDAVTSWFTNADALILGCVLVAVVIVVLLVRYARNSDLAPDAHDVEYYIEDLNDAAGVRIYDDYELNDEYDDEDEFSTMR